MTREGCKFPDLAAATAYGKGCRCEGCRAWKCARDAAYYEANREKERARQRAYYEASREKVSARKRAYREANREKLNAQKRAYREANREKVNAGQRAHYEANREKASAGVRAWRAENVALVREAGRARRKRMRLAAPTLRSGPWSAWEDELLIAWQYTDLALAQRLGRSYGAVMQRKGRLRKKGLIP